MIMNSFWCFCVLISTLCALPSGRAGAIAGALIDGASSAVTVSIAIAGPLCLWNGLGNLMERVGITALLSRFLRPVLSRLFPGSRRDPELAGALSANVCANLLGLGNAATPMGIRATRRLADPARPGIATDEMCRLVVMNTASIQLLPTTVAAVRAGAGCATPFDILPCVWISSILSVSAGLGAAAVLRRCWHDV